MLEETTRARGCDTTWKPRPFLTIGADPELFVVDNNGHTLPPKALRDYPGDPYSLLAEDGAQLELHPTPSYCRGYFADYMRFALRQAITFAASLECTLHIRPAIETPARILKTFPPNALVFGCDPDWDAYTLDVSTKPLDARQHFYRYGAGHLHLGVGLPSASLTQPSRNAPPDYKNFLVENVSSTDLPYLVILMDAVVGVMDVAMDIATTESRLRRKHVGKAGCFRMQPHGIEYRTPSNTWLRHPKLLYVMSGLLRDSWHIFYRHLLNEKLDVMRRTLQHCAPTLQQIINEVDVTAARSFWLAEVAPMLESLEERAYSSDSYKAKRILTVLDNHILPQAKRSHVLDEALWALDEVSCRSGSRGDAALAYHGSWCKGGIENLLAENW